MNPAWDWPAFYLFGFGHRRKLMYRGGVLSDALTGEVLKRWEVGSERVEAGEYRVMLETKRGVVRIVEDEDGVWAEEGGDRVALTLGRVKLPRFEGHAHAAALRVLHGEILVNIMPFGPVPNLWVYPRPWYRDAAMMLMVLKQTGNLALVEPWVNGLVKVFDRNNAGVAEADNPGQVLYMVSLVSDRHHSIVERVLKEVKQFEKDRHIVGFSDGAQHPVYQTKWLKYGLRALGLEDPYRIPCVVDSYSSLFWMDYREEHVAGPRHGAHALERYPYLNWAEAHFYREPPPAEVKVQYPMTWESEASEAAYWRMHDAAGADVRTAAPHTWHAAEMFLYLIEDLKKV